jgi:NitT/TauT family transport system substrate-binding protein
MRANRHRVITAFGSWLAITAAIFAPATAKAEDVIVTLWGTGMFGVPYAVALEKGFFKDANLPITGVISGSGGGTVVRNILANSLPFGEAALPAAIAAQKQGLPVIVLCAGARSFDNSWVVMPNSPIKTIQDVVGKRIAYTNPKSISDIFVQVLLKNNKIDLDKVKRVSAGGYGQGLTLLENNGVDIAPITEPLRTQTKNKFRVVFGAADALPPMISATCVTTREFADKNPEKLKAILAVRQRSIQYVYAHPEESGRITAKAYKIPEDVAVEAVTEMAKLHQWSEGDIDLNEFNNTAEGMRLVGDLTGDVDWKSLIDTSYLPPDLTRKSKLDLK